MSLSPTPVPAPKTTWRARPLADRLNTRVLARTNTSYWETWDSRLIRAMPNQVCFGSCCWSLTQSIRYLVPAGEGVTSEMLRFWVRFMRHVLPDDLPWSARLVDVPMRVDRYSDVTAPSVPTLYVRLHRMAANSKTSLVYCSLIRYPKQWPAMVVALYAARESCDTPNAMFLLMQEMHKGEGAHTAFRYVSDSHTPIMNRRPSAWGSTWTEAMLSSEQPVSIEAFHAACRSGKATTASAHFRSDLVPDSADQKVPLRPILTVAAGIKACAHGMPKPVFTGAPAPFVVPQAVIHIAQAAPNAAPVTGSSPVRVDTAAVASLW